jgi:glutamyl-tRNA synthetase
MSLTENGVSPLVEEEDRGYVNDALSLLPKSKLNEQSWDQWTKEIKSQSDRKGKQLFLPLRKALTGKENGPDMSRLLPLLKKIPAKV